MKSELISIQERLAMVRENLKLLPQSIGKDAVECELNIAIRELGALLERETVTIKNKRR